MPAHRTKTILFLTFALGVPNGHAAEETLKFLRVSKGKSQALLQLSFSEIQKTSRIEIDERDLTGGNTVSWKGARLNDWIERSLENVKPGEQAMIDLVVLRDGQGREVTVPRSFVIRFPVLLATQKEGEPLGTEGPVAAIVPAQTKPRLQSLLVPWRNYSLGSVKEVILTSFEDYYGSGIFLAYRRDPLAIRGEKRFMQNCMQCHGNQQPAGGLIQRSLTLGAQVFEKHQSVDGMPRFSEFERRSLLRYLQTQQKGTNTVASQSAPNRFLFDPN